MNDAKAGERQIIAKTSSIAIINLKMRALSFSGVTHHVSRQSNALSYAQLMVMKQCPLISFNNKAFYLLVDALLFVVNWISGDQVIEGVMTRLEDFLNHLSRALIAHASGLGIAPPRLSFNIGSDWWGVMPGYVGGGVTVKVVGVHPGNAGIGLPTVTATAAYFDERGSLVALIDGEALTGIRTAAATAIGARVVNAPTSSLGIVGTGVEARYHLLLLREALRPRRVLVWGRRMDKARTLAEEFGGEAVELSDLLSSDIIVLTTSSTSPIVEDVPRGRRHVASIGAPRPVVELGRKLIERVGCVLVDTRNAINEAGEDLRGVKLVELGEALRGVKCEVSDASIYKGVGFAVLDAAAADFIVESALRHSMTSRR